MRLSIRGNCAPIYACPTRLAFMVRHMANTLSRRRRLIPVILSLLTLLGLTAARVAANTYYVANNGSDNNSGSATAPFLTIQNAANLVVPGDTVIVRQGNYAGFVLGWDTPTAGTPMAPITFTADPAAPAGSVVINFRNSKTYTGIDLEPGCDYINLNGFTVIGGSASQIAVYPNKGSGIKATGNYDQITNCTIHDLNYAFGILADSAVGVLIQG